MRQARELNPIPIGIIGTVVIALLTLAALNLRALPFVDSATGYRALVTETAGLSVGDPVQVAGVTVGSVREVHIEGATVAITFGVDDAIEMGEQTRADIATATVLGTKLLRVTPAGEGRLDKGATIPLERTSSPYQLTNALGDLTDTAREIDSGQLSDSMRELAGVLRETPEDLSAALDGVTRLSQTVASRDESLRELLEHAENATGALAQRSEQVEALLVDGDAVLVELIRRAAAIESLSTQIGTLSQQLTGLVADNRDQLSPALAHLESVLAMLNANRDDIAGAIERLGPYVTELGEAVASGPYFNSYIQNLLPGQLIEPFVRAALGEEAPK
ncbi:MCE family protein [Tomitella biformata]|uniref:MCE family protein n=1 Tax=Tomitella biformata TaxID=630403 RepID=UPI000465B3F7|nr:MCE family protein [Tomitella biformata]